MAECRESCNEEEQTSFDIRQVVVRNIPEACDEDIIRDLFESRRQFGESLSVERVEKLSLHEAVVTFQKGEDVGRVLKRQEESPLVLCKQELMIKEKLEVEDVIYDFGDRLSITSTVGSMESLTSFCSMTTLDSSVLFGSGKGRPDCFRPLCSEIQLEYVSPSGQTNKRLLNLQEIAASSAAVSYAGSTQYANVVPRRRETILQIKLEEILKRPVCVTETNDMFTIKVSKPRDNESNVDDVENTVKETLKSLEVEITVQLLEINANHADVAIKHLESFVSENKGIKLYRTEEETTILITCQTEDEKGLVSEHVDIINRQRVVELESKLSEADYFKLQGFKQKIKQQKAIVVVEDGRLIIRGYEEDVQSTLIAVNKIKLKYCHEQRHLPGFAADMLKEKHVHKMIQKQLKEQHLKVWWKLADKVVHIVGEKKQIEAADAMFRSLFCETEIDLPQYLIESESWRKVRTVESKMFGKSICIEEDATQSKVTLKGSPEACLQVSNAIEHLKSKCLRESKAFALSQSHRNFVAKHLSKDIETTVDERFLKIEVDTEGHSFRMEGTRAALEESVLYIRNLATVIRWIAKDELVPRIQHVAGMKEWEGIIEVVENKVTIELKFGRIEEEQTDVLVNSTARDLVLGVGPENTINKSLFLKAGDDAQKYLEDIDRPVNFGAVVQGSPGKLKCKKIFHVVLDKFNAVKKDEQVKILRDVTQRCLEGASNEGYTSISFPALCTGVNGYPVQAAAEAMFNAIVAEIREGTSLITSISIVFLESDKDKLKVFENERKRRQKCLSESPALLLEDSAWPCRYKCHITGKTKNKAAEYLAKLENELGKQTSQKQ